MKKDSIFINQSGMNTDSDWMHEGVYLNYCFAERDYFYVGESKCFGNRDTSYSTMVSNILCEHPDSARSLICYWKSSLVDRTLVSVGKSCFISTSKKPLRKVIEGAGMSHFVFDTYQKCNRTKITLSIDELRFGVSIIILSRKYPIHTSIILSEKIFKDLSPNAHTVYERDTDTEDIRELKKEYNTISSEFFNYIAAGLVIAQQGYKRVVGTVRHEKYLFNSDNLAIFFGDIEKHFENCTMLENDKFIRIYRDNESKKILIHIRNYYNPCELLCTDDELEDIFKEISMYTELTEEHKSIISNSINFVPIL